jgi:hypothetical protein
MHSNLLSGSPLLPCPPSLCQSTVYRQCVAERGVGVLRPEWRGPQTDNHLPQSPFTGQFFFMTTFCISFYQSNLSTVTTVGLIQKPPPPPSPPVKKW